jgi:hypothetical protein
MLSTIELHNQPVLDRSEVGDEWTDRDLSSKFHAVQPAVAQQAPLDSFGVGRGAPKRTSDVSLLAIAHLLPSPLALTRPLRGLPLPQAGEGHFFTCQKSTDLRHAIKTCGTLSTLSCERSRNSFVSGMATRLDIRPRFSYIPATSLSEGAFPEGQA